ncbi:MAG: winged helix-turn-helix domain-containing protein [Firmicutes bacterium]|jgi:DNA-binding transcriptional ArsR family regulator|nr:winged helix-turn-helix domain-containing protein [Bacillota bacterium]
MIDRLKRYFVVQDYDTLRVLSDPIRMQILGILIGHEKTGKQIADQMKISGSRSHYHLKELEQKNVVKIVRTEEKNGILQKFYRAVAFDYVIDEELLPVIYSKPVLFQDVLVTQLHMAISRIHNTPSEAFPLIGDADDGSYPFGLSSPFICGAYEFKIARDAARKWIEKYRALLSELEAIDLACRQQAQEDSSEDAHEVFFLQNIGFMTSQEYFVSADEDLPPDYQWAGRGIVRRTNRDRTQ